MESEHGMTNSPYVPTHLRGKIICDNKPIPIKPRLGGNMITNKEYAKDKGITKRQASKLRRGY
jgi:hypothetical protein